MIPVSHAQEKNIQIAYHALVTLPSKADNALAKRVSTYLNRIANTSSQLDISMGKTIYGLRITD
jgi:hypothetical protein